MKTKHDITTKAFIRYAKKWLSCDKYSILKLDTTDGTFKAVVISESDSKILKIEISRDNEIITIIQYNHDLNKWNETQ